MDKLGLIRIIFPPHFHPSPRLTKRVHVVILTIGVNNAMESQVVTDKLHCIVNRVSSELFRRGIMEENQTVHNVHFLYDLVPYIGSGENVFD